MNSDPPDRKKPGWPKGRPRKTERPRILSPEQEAEFIRHLKIAAEARDTVAMAALLMLNEAR